MEFLYKYRNITNENIENCYNIQNLINNKATISSRKSFDDSDDSKIIFIKPNFNDFKLLKKQIPSKRLHEFKTLKNKDGYTKRANLLFKEIEKKFDKLIDDYGIYCLTDKANNEFLWQNYADDYKGFCIKFKKKEFANEFNVYPIKYEDELSKLNLLEMLKIYFEVDFNKEIFGKNICDKLCTKLNEYIDENEYRYIMKGKLEGKEYILKNYNKEVVEEVIFGFNMKREIKEYILNNTNFKCSQLIKKDNSLSIIPFDINKHLYHFN